MTTERDIRNQIRFAEKTGAKQKAIEIARQMLTDSVPPETVAKYTGLSADEIAAL